MDPEEVALLNRLVALVKDPGPYERSYQVRAVLDAFNKVDAEHDETTPNHLQELMADAYSWVRDWEWYTKEDETYKTLQEWFVYEVKDYLYSRVCLGA